MKKLITMFKNLPPEVRMMVAMAGLGSPIGAIYLLKRFFFPTTPTIYLILGIAVVIGVISLLGFLITKIFGGKSASRRKRMEAELAGAGEGGMVSMDARAAAKGNTEKFFNAIKDMRKNAGVNVYDLPWYIVIGDSGCGKTKLINEGGLVFSLGKPEGYQLGTLNYNWWFTEDAVFVDMAGRLCNPQDDADRREWSSFLDTIGKGRKGYPINGALVCVSIEHLLQDSPEKHEQDANTALERLRDLQTKLGVTFATYLVITKCDKILGFMQFFDRAERDITIKNQIFGWSRPGEFNELYDPETFGNDLDGLYGRLNELRIRRLNDEVDEIELGLAYSFPEEFRQISDPLKTYIRTLFPMIKNPRAIKNLIFRGIYFTSATQVGGVILKHLTERLGNEAADQFPPLESLYPQPRPHFVKDLLFRKVFPEYGLVFRNEQQVVRNRKLSRMLKIGSGVLALLLAGAFTWSILSFSKLIGTPREHARLAPTQLSVPQTAMAGVEKLVGDVETLRGNPWPARVLSLGIGAQEPIRDLTLIQVRLFEKALLGKTLADVDKALRTTQLANAREGKEAIAAAADYQESLKQYLLWLGLADVDKPPSELTYESFQKLCRVVTDRDAPVVAQKASFDKSAGIYFSTIKDTSLGDWKNPARLLRLTPGIQPAETVRAGIANVHRFMEGYAVIAGRNPNPAIGEWMRIADLCAQAESAYGEMLASKAADIDTQQELMDFQKQFTDGYQRFAGAADPAECTWKIREDRNQFVRIPTLQGAILAARQHWIDYQQELLEAYTGQAASSAPAVVSMRSSDPKVVETIGWLSRGESESSNIRGLDRVCYDSLKEAKLTEQRWMDDFFGENFPKFVQEVHVYYAHMIALRLAGSEPQDDVLQLSAQTDSVKRVLGEINAQLVKASFDPAGDLRAQTPKEWIAVLEKALFEQPKGGAGAAAGGAGGLTIGELHQRWRKPELEALYQAYQGLIIKGEGTILLTTIATRLDKLGPWGYAELYTANPLWNSRSPDASAYQIPLPVEPKDTSDPASAIRRPDAPATQEVSPPEAPAIRRPDSEPPRAPEGTTLRRPDDGAARRPDQDPPREPVAPVRPAEPTAVAAAGGEGGVPRSATHTFLNDVVWDFVKLRVYLPQFDESRFLTGTGDSARLNDRCVQGLDSAGRLYADAYIKAWSEAYQKKNLPLFDKLMTERAGNWSGLTTAFSDRRAPTDPDPVTIGRELRMALSEVLQQVRWATWNPKRGWWGEQTDPEWHKARDWFDVAMRGSWAASNGQFAVQAQQPSPDPTGALQPWEAIAIDFERSFNQFASALASNRELPRQFTPDIREQAPIDWDRIATLREQYRLGDEKLTGAVQGLSERGRQLLSAELTDILRGVQNRYFSGGQAGEGWPYAGGGLDTVPYEKFKQFLLEVNEAARVFAPLEKGIPDGDSSKQTRLQLYRQCQEWRAFIGYNSQGTPAPLGVKVQTLDPRDPTGPGGICQNVQDTPQLYYRRVELYLGLDVQSGGAVSSGPLRIDTAAKGQSASAEGFWRWSGAGGPLKMQLADPLQGEGKPQPYPDIESLVFGSGSELGFVAYLHAHAQPGDKDGLVWVTCHGQNLAQAFAAKGLGNLAPPANKGVVGEKFLIRLDRALPAPIRPL